MQSNAAEKKATHFLLHRMVHARVNYELVSSSIDIPLQLHSRATKARRHDSAPTPYNGSNGSSQD